ncbi:MULTISPECIES: helix-turn-helix transcriptional regulator [Acidiphilium]|uniref:ArsR/SmtB family transcription factor n=1 Tax=Acidiphilium TaxID=522 RepID=UPI00054FA5D7|nr:MULTISPECIES: helix-turn-helix transcriptional regulator [Acidiphilium]MCW8308073.1 ArsR family transcriptional regulator [Acidiphilium sp. PA]OYW12638.1 MAG: transcriptional regulator [Acidiphilium sp. 37-67-22]OZB23456.1 MAG: transcriptional regulator [Acidiphilium sp. 34-64-41]
MTMPRTSKTDPAWMVTALAALAHEHRLAAYRLLVEAGPSGIAAGNIAEKLGLVPSSLTFHVQALRNAGLISQRRASRHVIYAADFTAMNTLVGFLVENCCGQGISICGPACDPALPSAKQKTMRAKAKSA